MLTSLPLGQLHASLVTMYWPLGQCGVRCNSVHVSGHTALLLLGMSVCVEMYVPGSETSLAGDLCDMEPTSLNIIIIVCL